MARTEQEINQIVYLVSVLLLDTITGLNKILTGKYSKRATDSARIYVERKSREKLSQEIRNIESLGMRVGSDLKQDLRLPEKEQRIIDWYNDYSVFMKTNYSSQNFVNEDSGNLAISKCNDLIKILNESNMETIRITKK